MGRSIGRASHLRPIKVGVKMQPPAGSLSDRVFRDLSDQSRSTVRPLIRTFQPSGMAITNLRISRIVWRTAVTKAACTARGAPLGFSCSIKLAALRSGVQLFLVHGLWPEVRGQLAVVTHLLLVPTASGGPARPRSCAATNGWGIREW